MPQGTLASFLMQLVMPQPDAQATAIVTEAMLRPPRPDCVSVLLDIDVYRDTTVPNDEEEIWNYFERLRLLKNDLFESSITDRSRDLFK